MHSFWMTEKIYEQIHSSQIKATQRMPLTMHTNDKVKRKKIHEIFTAVNCPTMWKATEKKKKPTHNIYSNIDFYFIWKIFLYETTHTKLTIVLIFHFEQVGERTAKEQVSCIQKVTSENIVYSVRLHYLNGKSHSTAVKWWYFPHFTQATTCQ